MTIPNAKRGLVEALAKVDAIECPLSGGKSFDRCPKCGATADQNCGPWVTAVSGLEDAVRAALASISSPEEGDARKAVALWMIERGYVTGHGDTLDQLLGELVMAVRHESGSLAKADEIAAILGIALP